MSSFLGEPMSLSKTIRAIPLGAHLDIPYADDAERRRWQKAAYYLNGYASTWFFTQVVSLGVLRVFHVAARPEATTYGTPKSVATLKAILRIEAKYPFGRMRVNQRKAHQFKTMEGALAARQACYHYAEYTGKKFKTRLHGNRLLEVWRLPLVPTVPPKDRTTIIPFDRTYRSYEFRKLRENETWIIRCAGYKAAMDLQNHITNFATANQWAIAVTVNRDAIVKAKRLVGMRVMHQNAVHYKKGKYPFCSMAVGDYIKVKAQSIEKLRRAVYSLQRRFDRRYRTQLDGAYFKVWRIA